jgi:PAS domain S-box-containing protein
LTARPFRFVDWICHCPETEVAVGKPTPHEKPKTKASSSGKTVPENKSHPVTIPKGLKDEDACSALFVSMLDSLDIGIANVDIQGKILYANSKFAELLGKYSVQEVEGGNLMRFVSPAGWQFLQSAVQQAVFRTIEGQMKVIGDHPSAQRTIALSFSPVSNGTKDSVRIVAREVTEILATKTALKESEATLHSLSARLLLVQDEERRKIARDLHDVIGQELAVTVMSLESIAGKIEKTDERLKNQIADAVDYVRRIDTEVRTLSYLLHPPLLDETGLRSALSWFIDGFAKRTGIEVNTDLPKGIPRLHKGKEAALFRVVQECLTNVFRHSGSKKARVRISVDDSYLEACVEDEGRGFESEKATPKGGVGIQSMRGRLEAYGGSLAIHSRPRHTEIIARMPRSIAEQALEEVATELNAAPQEQEQEQEHAGRNRVLIADDHEVARQGIRFMLQGELDLEVCGEASDGLEAVQKARQLKPDLIILDVSMPHLSGFSAATQIRRADLSTKILIFTTHSYPDLARLARASGCNGFVMKSNASHDLLRAARAVLRGGEFYGSETPVGAKTKAAV